MPIATRLTSNGTYYVNGSFDEVGWTPAELGSSLALWLDAADTSTVILNGSTVSQWNDKSGNGNHVSQAIAANQPAYSTGLVTFDGTNDALIAATPIITTTDAGTVTMFSVSSLVAGESGYLYGAIDGATGCGLYQENNNIGFARTPAGAFSNQRPHGIALPGQGVIGVVFSGNTANHSFNGTITSVTGGLAFTAPTVEFTLGNRRNGASAATYWQGGHREIVVSNTALSTTDRQKLEGYLAHKWGLTANLPADHPYKTSPPSSTRVSVSADTVRAAEFDERNWTPAALGSSLALWLDAADSSTVILNGSTVSRWDDKSGNGRHVSQATSTRQPTYNATGLNGKPTLSFDGNNDSLKNATYEPTGAVSAFVVFNRNATKGTLLNVQRSGGIFEITGKFDATYKTVTLTARGGVNPSFGFDIVGDGVNQNIILGVQHNDGTNTATNFTGHWNGDLQTIVNSGALGFLSETGFSVGGRPVQDLPAAYYPGLISEIIFRNSTTTTTDREKIEGYLAHKWGLTANLPADHPYKNTTPSLSLEPGIAKRELSTGVLQVSGEFDEFTGAPVVDSSLVLWLDAAQPASYPGSGTVWTDLSGRANTGTLVNGPTFSGDNGGSIVLDGVDDYAITISSFVNSANSPISISLWFRTNTLTLDGAFFRRILAFTNNHGILTNTTSVGWYTSGANIIAAVNISTDIWYKVDYVYTETQHQIYLNGNLGNTNTSSNAAINSPLWIGRYDLSNNGRFNGNISQITIYNRALTADEIATNFNALRGRYGI